MNRIVVVIWFLALSQLSVAADTANDTGTRDKLRLEVSDDGDEKVRVTVSVLNDQELASLDIPLKFAQPGDSVTLEKVEWSDRVKDWDFKHAAIDNVNKTVIIGLISELTVMRENANLTVWAGGNAEVASLLFGVKKGIKPDCSTFETKHPDHALTFLYNHYESGKPHVKEYAPILEVSDLLK